MLHTIQLLRRTVVTGDNPKLLHHQNKENNTTRWPSRSEVNVNPMAAVGFRDSGDSSVERSVFPVSGQLVGS